MKYDRAIKRAEALIREVLPASPEEIRRSRIQHCIRTSKTPRELIKMVRAIDPLPESETWD